jgi:serine/threonine-protein kinase
MGRDEVAEDALIGRTIADNYSIEALVGRGAMGTVYKARQLSLMRKVALKVMKVHGSTDRKYAARFKREAKTASLLDHPNVARVVDFGQEPDGVLYIAMEYLEGRHLLSVLAEEWPLSTERIVGVLSQTLSGVAAAHEMGVVHRDLKPENIMLIKAKDDDGTEIESVKVCDFGVAKLSEEGPVEPPQSVHMRTSSSTQTTLTAHGMTVGTPGYMAPEQALGEVTDARSDIYAMGVILYQVLTRRLPFEAATALQVMIAHIEKEPTRPSEFIPDVNRRLERVCMKALRKKPERRYQSAREMRAELRLALENSNPSSRPPPPISQQESVPTIRPPSTAERSAARRSVQGIGPWLLAATLIALGVAVAYAGLRG